MSRSKSMAETIKNILGCFFFGSLAFLFLANAVGFAVAFGLMFVLVPLFLPFVFLIIGLSKDQKPSTSSAGSRKYSYELDQEERGGFGKSVWSDDDYFINPSSSFSDSDSSSDLFADDGFSSSGDDFLQETTLNPMYAYYEHNVHHHND